MSPRYAPRLRLKKFTQLDLRWGSATIEPKTSVPVEKTVMDRIHGDNIKDGSHYTRGYAYSHPVTNATYIGYAPYIKQAVAWSYSVILQVPMSQAAVSLKTTYN